MQVLFRFLLLLLIGVALNPTVLIYVPVVVDFVSYHIDDFLAAKIWLWLIAGHVIGFLALVGFLVIRRWTFRVLALTATMWCIYAVYINASLYSISSIGNFSLELKSVAALVGEEWRFAAVVMSSLCVGVVVGWMIFSRRQFGSG